MNLLHQKRIDYKVQSRVGREVNLLSQMAMNHGHLIQRI
jgi:hypothetical protein